MGLNRPDFHINFLPKGQKGNIMSSFSTKLHYTDKNTGRITSTDHGTEEMTRDVWDHLIKQAIETGEMTHPDTGAQIQEATLRYGGEFDKDGNAHGGMKAERWSATTGYEVIDVPNTDYQRILAEEKAAAITQAELDALPPAEEVEGPDEIGLGDPGDETDSAQPVSEPEVPPSSEAPAETVEEPSVPAEEVGAVEAAD